MAALLTGWIKFEEKQVEAEILKQLRAILAQARGKSGGDSRGLGLREMRRIV
jgi:hypothetical protein